MSIMVFGEITEDWIASIALEESSRFALLGKASHSLGGRGANAAIAASIMSQYLNGPSVYLGALTGREFVSSDYQSILARHKIDMTHCSHDAEGFLSSAFVFRGKEIKTFFRPIAEASGLVQYAQGLARTLRERNLDAIYATSGNSEADLCVLQAAGNSCKYYAPGPDIYNMSANECMELVALSDMVFVNEDEAAQLGQLFSGTLGDITAQHKLRCIVNTLAAAGSAIHTETKVVHIPPCLPRSVSDETGAGDAFAGAFVAAYALHNDAVLATRS